MSKLAAGLAMTALVFSAPATALSESEFTVDTIETPKAKAKAADLAADAYADFVMHFDQTDIRPNRYVWDADGATGQATIIISLERQMAFAYRGDTLVGAASVSTAKEGKITPTGQFPVWLKKRMHHSRTYNNAPMPYMQMIDHYGIALHAGHNPGYPASEGCIRLPNSFAKKLFAITDIGTEVYIGA